MGRLKIAVLWSYLLTTGGMAITGVLTFVLAAILDPESFGVLALGMLWVTFAQMMLQHGPTMAVVQLKEVSDEQVNAAFWTTVAGAAVFGGVFALLAPAWGAANNLPGLAPVCWALIGVTLLISISVIPDAMLRRQMQFRGIALRGLAGALLGGLAGIGGALAGWGVWALVAQQLVGAGVYTLTVWSVTDWRPRYPRPVAIVRGLAGLRSQSLQTLGGAVGVFLSTRMDVLLMGAFFGPVMIGLYRFALRLAEMVVDVTSRGLQAVSLPELARHQSDRETLGRRLADLVHVAVVLSVPALAVLAAVAEPMVLLIGPQWAAAAAPLRILCAVSAVGTATALLGPAMQAVQRAGVPAALTWVSAVASGLGLGAAAWLSSGHGMINQLTAVASAALAVQTLQLVVSGFIAYRFVLKVPVLPSIKAAAPALVAAAAGFCAALAAQWFWPADVPLVRLLIGAAPGALTVLVMLLALDAPLRSRLARRRRPDASEQTMPEQTTPEQVTPAPAPARV